MYIVQSMVFALYVYEIIILCACKVSTLAQAKCLNNLHSFYLASNPGSPFRILSRSFGEKLRDKIRNGEPGFEVSFY